MADDKLEPGVDIGALERLESGIPRLDAILKGGFVRGGTYTLYGPPGAGKTIFANQLCFNVASQPDKTCLYLTVLAESHAKMLKHLSGLHFFDPKIVGGRLKYLAGYQTLKESGLEGLLNLIRNSVLESRPSVLVIDGLESVEQAAGPRAQSKEFLHELQSATAFTQTTTLLCAVEQPGNARRD